MKKPEYRDDREILIVLVDKVDGLCYKVDAINGRVTSNVNRLTVVEQTIGSLQNSTNVILGNKVVLGVSGAAVTAVSSLTFAVGKALGWW